MGFGILNRTRTPLNQDDTGMLIALVAFLFGAWLRLMPPTLAGFPINDGGLFYVMAEAIRENGYLLPSFVSYNGLQIPFSYPPLAFYVVSGLSDLFNFSLIEIFRWFPGIVLIGTLIAFYELAKVVLHSRFEAGLATLVYALLPRSVTWLIMGGGVTRSLGQLFLMLTMLFVYRLFTEKQKKLLIPSIIFSALVCVTHPEAALHTIVICAVLLVFRGRDKQAVVYAAVVAVGTLILTSVWWLPMFLRFGLEPFVSAAQTGLHSFTYVVYFFFVPFSEEPYITFIVVLAVLGITVKIAQSDFLLPILYALPFLIEPRNAPNVVTIHMALLSSVALSTLIFPGLRQLESGIRKIEFSNMVQSRAEKLALLYIGMNLLIGMFYFDMRLAERRVSSSTREAFAWIADNTPEQSRFLLLTGATDPFADWTKEWFPVLTERISLTTLQGYEWLEGGENFRSRIAVIQEIKDCPIENDPLDCINGNLELLASDYDFVYITRTTTENNFTTPQSDRLIVQLQTDADFLQVYESKDIFIFRKQALP